MQNAKDTFYQVLRDRIAGGNAERTVVVRGVARPAVLVEENELPSYERPTETFVLRWTEVEVDSRGALPRVAMTCAVRYETCGGADAGGLDRGRRLAAMDAELIRALLTRPQSALKTDVSVTPPAAYDTQIFWGTPALGPLENTPERVGRTATVTVYSYEEAGER